jgi:hypothetical protein
MSLTWGTAPGMRIIMLAWMVEEKGTVRDALAYL